MEGTQRYLLGVYTLNNAQSILYAPPRGALYNESFHLFDPLFTAPSGNGGPDTNYYKLTGTSSSASATYVVDKARVVFSGSTYITNAGVRWFGLEIANAGGSLAYLELCALYVPNATPDTPGAMYDTGLIDFGPYGWGPDNITSDAAGPGVRVGASADIYFTDSAISETVYGGMSIMLMYHQE